MIIAVDFDNCLIEPAPHPLYGFELKPHARETIINHHAKGTTFILNTARYGKHLRVAKRFLKQKGLPIAISKRKPQADIYIDDKNIFCTGIDWIEIDKELGKYETGE